MSSSRLSRSVSSLIASSVVLYSFGASTARAQWVDLPTREVPLTVTHRVVSYEPVLRKPIRDIAQTQRFIAFSDHRDLWILQPGQPLSRLADRLHLPDGFDWYGTLCAAGDKLAASVGAYPEEQRRRELETPRGAYRGGPQPVGVLVFTENEARLVQEFPVDSVDPRVRLPFGEPPPRQIRPWIQSCHWDGTALIVGAYGLLARLDLRSDSARLLDLDAELEFNRKAILAEKDALWVSLDEGGASGGCVEKLRGKEASRYCLLGYNNSELDPDAILKHQARLLTSSLAGIVEIDERAGAYVHYQLNSDRSQMRVFELAVIQDQLWAIREDGFVRFNLPFRAATHFRLEGEEISNDIHGLTYFNGIWYVATEDMLVAVKSRDLE